MRRPEATQAQWPLQAQGVPPEPYSCSVPALFLPFWEQGESRGLSSLLLPHYVSSWPRRVQRNTQRHILLLPAPPLDYCHRHPQLAAKSHPKFLSKSAILTTVVQNTSSEEGS